MTYEELKEELDDNLYEEECFTNHRYKMAKDFIANMKFQRGDIIRVDGIKYEIIETEYDADLNVIYTSAFRIYPEGCRSYEIFEEHHLNIEKVLNAELVKKGNGKIQEDN